MSEDYNKKTNENKIEGRNAVLEAFRSGKTIDKLFVQDGCKDGPILSITREARKHDTLIKYVTKERLDQLSETGKHQGVIAYAAAYEYAEVEDILKNAREKGEEPFIFLLDNIEDPHNLERFRKGEGAKNGAKTAFLCEMCKFSTNWEARSGCCADGKRARAQRRASCPRCCQ